MLTKIIFVIIDCLAVFALYFTVRATDRIDRLYARWLKRTLLAGIVAIYANILIAFSFSNFFAHFAYSFYFASIDWILFFLVGFCLAYTEHEQALLKMAPVAAVVMALDSVSILLNTFFDHEFYVFAKRDSEGVVFYQTRPFLPFYLHLTIDYVAIIIAFIFILYRIVNSYSFYRTKYDIILSVLLLVVALNIAYMMFELPLDASVMFYALAGTLIYFSIQKLVPQGLMVSSIGRAVDDMNEGLILFDIADNCIYANAFSRQRFSIEPSEYNLSCEPVHTVLEALHAEGASTGAQAYRQTVTRGDNVVTEHYLIKYTQLKDSRSRLIGSYFLVEDNTEQVHYLAEIESARDQANEANKAKSTFLANMSHEIRTPLNSVLGMNEMILRSTDDPQLREYAESIKLSGDTLLSLINDVLDFSKIEANRMDIIPVEYNPHDLLRECYHYFEQMAESKDLYIDVTCDETIPSRLMGDEKLIRQIMTNIISNAIKYTREGGVKVHMSDEGTASDVRDMVITVSDTGIGIEQEDINYLFDAFKRINEKENATIQGTGLGLAITKELVTLMHGTISVHSTPGQGSVFTIVIPQKIVDKTPVGEFKKHIDTDRKEYKESFRAPDARILIVDDAKLNLKVAQALLKSTLIQCDTASGGDKAIEMCRDTKYDLILLDHRMPEPDGIQTFHVISKEGLNTDTPVIMLTANVVSGAEEEYMRIGFADYLSKPIHGDELEATLIKHLPAEKVYT